MKILSIFLLLLPSTYMHCMNPLDALNRSLHIAVALEKSEEVLQLLADGAWVNVPRPGARFLTPLNQAILFGYAGIAKILLNAGAARSVIVEGREVLLEPHKICVVREHIAPMESILKNFHGPSLPLERSSLLSKEEADK